MQKPMQPTWSSQPGHWWFISGMQLLQLPLLLAEAEVLGGYLAL